MSLFLRLTPLILFLAGCTAGSGGFAPAQFAMPPTPGGRLCVTQCRDAFDYCSKGCSLEQRSCSNDMQLQAIRDYDAYTRAQIMGKMPIELHVSDFERPEQCAPKLCMAGCRVPFTTCFTSCGGEITGHIPVIRLPFEKGLGS